ncbi:MAG: hypothetical protein JNJ60_13270 [Rhodocyclaceae bacterium]|nr:hypothetical protein [Rhodocyclaceae bacterium]
MKIAPSQIDALQDQAETEFVARVTQFLHAKHADAIAGLDAPELERRVRAGIARGRARGFTWQSSLAAFVALMFEIAPNFDLHPAFRRALELPAADETARIRAIHRNTTDRDWEEAQDHADPSAWYAPPPAV